MCVCVCLSVQDKSISTSIPVLELIDALQPNSVNFELVKTEDLSDEDKLDNAKYSPSCSSLTVCLLVSIMIVSKP